MERGAASRDVAELSRGKFKRMTPKGCLLLELGGPFCEPIVGVFALYQ